ncbi:MAG: hypothetical protein LH480_03870 [Rubrivivax sp.]|nr:hypothetical protein [Rubrivivax sp.]
MLSLFALALLWLVFSLWTAGQATVAVGALALGGSALWVYGTARSMAWKYLFPGIAGMLLFVAFPLVYTVQIGFTNYSSSNLLYEDRARNYLLEKTVVDEAQARPFTLHAEGNALRLKLMPADSGEAVTSPVLVSPPLDLKAGAPRRPVALQPLGSTVLGEPLNLRQLVALRSSLQPLVLQLQPQLPGQLADLQTIRYAGLREFGRIEPLWQAAAGGALRDVASGTVHTPNRNSGFF